MHWAIIIISFAVVLAVMGFFLSFPGFFLSLHPRQEEYCTRDSIPILSKEEAKRILSVLTQLPRREYNSVLSVVGTPAYLEGDGSGIVSTTWSSNYCRQAKQSNKMLLEHFGYLYTRIRERLEDYLGKKCKYLSCRSDKKDYLSSLNGKEGQVCLALPGFHFFRAGSWLGKGWPVASVHVDLQYDSINWPCEVDKEKTISFTLPLTCPPGTGLFLYSARKGEILSTLSLRWKERKYIPYTIGRMVVHDGHQFHVIAPFYSDDEDRITLQGHGIYCPEEDCYYLYW